MHTALNNPEERIDRPKQSHRVQGTQAVPRCTLEKRLGVSRGCHAEGPRSPGPKPRESGFPTAQDRAVRLIPPSPRKDYR